jgi:hypothetical protein
MREASLDDADTQGLTIFAAPDLLVFFVAVGVW